MACGNILVGMGKSAQHGPLAAVSAQTAAKKEAILLGVHARILDGVTFEMPSRRAMPLLVVH